MKKIKVLLLIFVIVVFIPTVYAGTAYVDSINIDAKINMDGSMTVVETIRWDIVEELNGVYRDILITNSSNELNSASTIVVSAVSNPIVWSVPATSLSIVQGTPTQFIPILVKANAPL